MSHEKSFQHDLWELIKDIKFGMLTHRHSDGGLHAHPLTTQNQKLQGQNATASINSRTDIARATTDTTIQVSGGSDRFVATVKGPLSAPKLSTTRAR